MKPDFSVSPPKPHAANTPRQVTVAASVAASIATSIDSPVASSVASTRPINGSASRLGIEPGHPPEESQQWFERAKKVLAGGISSSARSSTTGDLPYPLYITHGRGSRIWDADGNQFIDYLLSYGSAVLGHCDAELVEEVGRQLELGTMFGTCNTVEVLLAEQICRMVPCAELVRFANSGSEAICGAIRAARGFTGRDKILKFEGHYHGWVDVLAVSNRPLPADSGPFESPYSHPHSRGMTAGVVNDVIICPWNTSEIFKQILDKHDGQIAAVIAEPIVANNACIMPQPGYLEMLRDECSRRGIVLIFDEICTGFRTAPGGAQELFGVVPDIAMFSKALGGGLPISAFAGKRPIMDLVAANTVKHGGTYNGNPLCAVAALRTLQTLAEPSVQRRIRESGEAVIDAIRRSAADNHIPCVVQGLGAMFQVLFNASGQAPTQYRQLFDCDTKRYAAFRQSLLEQGVHINSSGSACWFVSAAHTADDASITCAAVEKAMTSIA
jgi:glutamate-1-semialdehyde 2,1-aminomutase